MNEAKDLTLQGHLRELRQRLIRSLFAVVIGTMVCFVFYQWLFYFLMQPSGGIELIYIEMTEMLGTVMKVCVWGGVMLAMPYLVYQVIMFISPALHKKEKKYVYMALPLIALMFLGGVLFAYFVLVPPALRFLLTFGSDIATPQIKVGNYISIVTRLMLSVGIVFELPVITTFLASLGILKPAWLADKRKVAIVGAFIIAAIITPTFDPVNQCLVALPLIVLYEMSIWLAKIVYRPGVFTQ
ncbi:twin-arginine translocase subunit TatC [Chloroflexota bacterium]